MTASICPHLAAGHERRTHDGSLKTVFCLIIGYYSGAPRRRPRAVAPSGAPPRAPWKRQTVQPFRSGILEKNFQESRMRISID
jgi:hypothetical protein